MPRTITVKGIGKVSTKPDLVVLSLEMVVKDKEYDKTMDSAAEQLAQLNECLASIGFEKESVKTTNFNVDTNYENYKDKQGNYKRVFSEYVCCHNLKLSFDFDMKKLSQALGAVVKCLAHPALNIEFSVKDATALNEELLREATVNAKRKAELLCEASGVELGQLLTIDYNWGELNIYSDTRYDMDECLLAAPEMGPRPIDIEPDDVEVRDTATFVWEIE